MTHTGGRLVLHYFYSQSTFISAVNVNWRAVLRKHKTHFLKLTRFHHFGRLPFSPVFSGPFLLFDKRWAFPVFFLRALMRKVCAWHYTLFRQRKYVLLCAVLLCACGRRQTSDRQEWRGDILRYSTARKYLSCLHFLFWKVWHFIGNERFFLEGLFSSAMLTLTEQIRSRNRAKVLSLLFFIPYAFSKGFYAYFTLDP